MLRPSELMRLKGYAIHGKGPQTGSANFMRAGVGQTRGRDPRSGLKRFDETESRRRKFDPELPFKIHLVNGWEA
jgi:hypothetical protein